MNLTLSKKKCQEGLNVCMNYEFNLLHHVGVVAKRVCGGDGARRGRQYPFGPNPPRGKKLSQQDYQIKLILEWNVFKLLFLFIFFWGGKIL